MLCDVCVSRGIIFQLFGRRYDYYDFFFSSFVILLAKLLSNPRINSWASTRCLPTQDIILRWHCHTCMSDDDVETVGHIMIMSLQLWGSKEYDNPRMKLKLDESICR